MSHAIATETQVEPAVTRTEVIARLRAQEAELRKLGATALHLFGSAVRDELTAESDVDLFIGYDPNGPLDDFKLCRMTDLAEAATGRDADLTTRAGLHLGLRDQIVRSSVPVF